MEKLNHFTIINLFGYKNHKLKFDDKQTRILVGENGYDYRKKNIFENKLNNFLERYHIENYEINPDGSIDVIGNVCFSNELLTEIPIKFRRVTGDFYCNYNNLKSLKNSPDFVGGNFNCSHNKLENLLGGPKEVKGIDCSYNNITSLIGCPEVLEGSFSCNHNKLKTLKFAAKKVGGHFDCFNNNLTNIDDSPEEIGETFRFSFNDITTIKKFPRVTGMIYYDNNTICNLIKVFKGWEKFKLSLDFGYLRGTTIIKMRFLEACRETGVKMPETLPGYVIV